MNLINKVVFIPKGKVKAGFESTEFLEAFRNVYVLTEDELQNLLSEAAEVGMDKVNP